MSNNKEKVVAFFHMLKDWKYLHFFYYLVRIDTKVELLHQRLWTFLILSMYCHSPSTKDCTNFYSLTQALSSVCFFKTIFYRQKQYYFNFAFLCLFMSLYSFSLHIFLNSSIFFHVMVAHVWLSCRSFSLAFVVIICLNVFCK